MTTLPQGDFEINNINSFANKMRCSVPLLNKLTQITEGNFNKIQKIGELTGNVPCRYCGQSYGINGKSEREIWIGMYFNNIIFTPEYLFVLGIHVDKKDKELLTKITRTKINFQFYNFPTVDEKWIFITWTITSFTVIYKRQKLKSIESSKSFCKCTPTITSI